MPENREPRGWTKMMIKREEVSIDGISDCVQMRRTRVISRRVRVQRAILFEFIVFVLEDLIVDWSNANIRLLI